VTSLAVMVSLSLFMFLTFWWLNLLTFPRLFR
jgi:hypothetical protein